MKEYQKRHLEPLIEQRLSWSPVVVLTGARQTGKSTLARHLPASAGWKYVSLDSLETLADASEDPQGFLEDEPTPLILDEVQRIPEMFLAIKHRVDQDRKPGRYLLTGSANPLLLKSVSESLAGRAVHLTLGPMTEREKSGGEPSAFWGLLAESSDARGLLQALPAPSSGKPWTEAVLEGGLPPSVLADSPGERISWLEGYVRTYLERDLRQFSDLDALADFRRLMGMLALRTGQVMNRAALGRDAGLPQTTAHRWLNLLEVTYQALRLPSYHVNRTKRLIKAPKLYWGDTGVGAFLAGVTGTEGMAGGWLENLVLVQLLAWREMQVPKPEVGYWRTASGQEVDFVLEWKKRLVPVEVKASVRVHAADARGLEAFLGEYGDLAPFGVLLYAGKEAYLLSGSVAAVPLGAVL